MNQTHLHRPTSRGSLFQWSVADRTVAACGTGTDRGATSVRVSTYGTNRGQPWPVPGAPRSTPHESECLFRQTFTTRHRPEVTAAEKKPRFGALPHPDQSGFDGISRLPLLDVRGGVARCPFRTTNRPQPQPPFNIWESGRVVSKLRIPPWTGRGLNHPGPREAAPLHCQIRDGSSPGTGHRGVEFERDVVLLLGHFPHPAALDLVAPVAGHLREIGQGVAGAAGVVGSVGELRCQLIEQRQRLPRMRSRRRRIA